MDVNKNQFSKETNGCGDMHGNSQVDDQHQHFKPVSSTGKEHCSYKAKVRGSIPLLAIHFWRHLQESVRLFLFSFFFLEVGKPQFDSAFTQIFINFI